MVSRPRLLLIDCDASPAPVQSVPTTLRRSATANRPAMSQPSFEPAVRSSATIGRKAYHKSFPAKAQRGKEKGFFFASLRLCGNVLVVIRNVAPVADRFALPAGM